MRPALEAEGEGEERLQAEQRPHVRRDTIADEGELVGVVENEVKESVEGQNRTQAATTREKAIVGNSNQYLAITHNKHQQSTCKATMLCAYVSTMASPECRIDTAANMSTSTRK